MHTHWLSKDLHYSKAFIQTSNRRQSFVVNRMEDSLLKSVLIPESLESDISDFGMQEESGVCRNDELALGGDAWLNIEKPKRSVITKLININHGNWFDK